MGSNRDQVNISNTSAAGSTIGYTYSFGGFIGHSN